MEKMRKMETNSEPSLLPAMLAFGSEKASPYSSAGDLAEGLVIAKKGLSKKRFLKQYCRGSNEATFENDPSCIISVLVGTRDAIHKWLRMSGFARCALWIEHASLEGGHEKIDSSATLELVYRQRDFRVFHVPVLQECKLVLALTRHLKSKQNKTKEFSKDDCEFDGNELRKCEFKQIDCRERSDGVGWWKGATMRWYILMKVPAFKKLSSMLSSGGALWEFRRLLLQVTNLPEFLDIDFQSINLQKRLIDHPYAVFLSGNDAIMTRTTSEGIFIWKLVRFDFDQGIVTLAGGETLKGLLCCTKKYISQKLEVQGLENCQQVKHDKLHQNPFEYENSKCCSLDWAVWQGVYQAGPMETILTSTFANDDDCMVLKSLTTFFSAWKDKDLCWCCTTCDLGTAFRECRDSIIQSSTWKLSLKERCAISHLHSVKREVRRQGLRALLDILFDEIRDLNVSCLQKSTLNTSRKSTSSTPMSSRADVGNTPLYFQQLVNSKREVYAKEKGNVSLLSGLMVVMDRPLKKKDLQKDKIIIGSETERALQAVEMKWMRFEEMKSDRSSSIGEKTYMRTRHAFRWQQVLEWVDNGFLEVLLKEGICYILEDGKGDFILVEDLANACLQVVSILPGEGSYCIVNFLISRLQNLIEVFTTLKVGTLQQVEPIKELPFRQKMEKLKMSLEEMVRFCRLLALLVVSSLSIASSLANLDGLFLMLKLYSIIVKEFPIDVKNLDILENDISTKALPGEVFGLEKYSPKVSKHDTPSNVKVPWLQKQKKTKSKRRLPLQEVLASSQTPLAFSTFNSKVLNITLDSNVQSHTPKASLFYTSKSKVPIPIDGDIANESCICPPQTLTTIIDVVWEAKLHLLQSLVTMFESQSIILNKCKAKMKEKLLVDTSSLEFLSWLLSDLIGGHSNAFPPSISHKLNKLIFKIIFLLDKDLEGDVLHIQSPQRNQFNFQYAEEGPWWSGPGPPPIQTFKIKLLDLMLVEVRERMEYILANLMATLPGHVLQDGQKLINYKKMTKDNAKEYIYSLWINLARLFLVLSDYISYWPTEEPKFEHVLQCCGGHFNQTLTLLACLGPIAGWVPAQILAMQNLLKLLSLCIKDSITIDAKDNWSKYENFLWEMLVDTWAHWNCIQSYVSWIALEVCQGCLISHLNNFQKSLLEPIYLYYLALEEQLNMRRDFEDVFENFQHSKLVPMKAMKFLRLVVFLAQRKFYTYNNNLKDGSTYLCSRNNALWFLHEIMNPIHGLLMMTIKNRPVQTCTDCKIEVINPSFVLEISSNIEQCSLILLAQIFSVKFFSSNVYVQESCGGCCTNIFLSKKYLIPFLHTLYSSFKNLYTRVIQQMGLNSLCTLQETHSWEDENKSPLTNQSSLESTTSNDKNIYSGMDEVLNLCYLHAEVLHAIAKNLSKDGNQIFKDLGVMDFFVQEISLEYKFSQIANSKFDFTNEMATNSTYTNPQRLLSRKDPKMLQGLRGSNSSSGSIGAYCMPPSLAQEYELKNSTLIYQDYMPQRSLDKCNVNDKNLFCSLEQCKINLETKIRVAKYSSDSKMKINVPPKNLNLSNNENIIQNVPVRLSCNPIYGTVNFGSKVDRDDLKSLWGIEYRKKKVVYSGRFFDLNEEVERELAMEEEGESNEEDKQTFVEEIEFTSTKRQTQSKNIRDASFSPISTRSTPCRSIERDIPPTLNTRPLVPKLNFTSAFQKTQSNMASCYDIEIISNDLEGQICSNEDVSVECKPSNLCVSYEKERLKRSIYHNSSLHILLLELIISLMLNPQGALEVYYCDRFPMENQKINAPFYLFYHINHPNNGYIVPILAKHLDAFHPSAYRVLKLTWQALFDPLLYTNRIRIAQGALSQVYTATRRTIKDGIFNNELVVLKVVALPKGPHEPCSFFDVYSEVQILERFQGDLRVCQILDYGVDRDAFVLVLKHYKCSLRAWRQRHTQRRSRGHGSDPVTADRKTSASANAAVHERLPLYLEVYAAVLQAVKALEVQNVVHYDLKCDNVLLEPLTCTLSDEDFWQPKWLPTDRTCAIPFRVSITDFGQSKASFVEGGECTARNRGTECVKSPEMLKLLSSSGNMDARQASTSSVEDEISVGKAGDVWGLGCLLYELLTGEYLLYDDDWIRFFMRVTLATEDLIPDEKAAKLDNYAPVIDFLRFILVRDPNNRPSLDDLVAYLEQLRAKLRMDNKQQPQLQESTPLDIFDELASDTEDAFEPQHQLPANAIPLRHHTADHAAYRRCQTPSVNKSIRRMHDKGQPKREPRLWRLWRLCCACCWRDHVDLMR